MHTTDRSSGDLGSSWTTVGGSWAIKDKRAYSTSVGGGAHGSVAFHNGAIFDDVSCQADIFKGETETAGVIARLSGRWPSSYYLAAIHSCPIAIDELGLWQVTPEGVFTLLAPKVEATWTDGDTLQLQCDGSSLTVKRNGERVIGPVTHTHITGGIHCGLRSSGTRSAFMNFSATSLLGAAA